MRIEDRIGTESAAQTGGATETQRTRQTGAGGAAGADGVSRDRLQLSSLAGRIRDSFETMAREQAGRVASLTAEVQSGRYQVDAGRLSQAMASELLGEVGI